MPFWRAVFIWSMFLTGSASDRTMPAVLDLAVGRGLLCGVAQPGEVLAGRGDEVREVVRDRRLGAGRRVRHVRLEVLEGGRLVRGDLGATPRRRRRSGRCRDARRRRLARAADAAADGAADEPLFEQAAIKAGPRIRPAPATALRVRNAAPADDASVRRWGRWARRAAMIESSSSEPLDQIRARTRGAVTPIGTPCDRLGSLRETLVHQRMASRHETTEFARVFRAPW